MKQQGLDAIVNTCIVIGILLFIAFIIYYEYAYNNQ